MIYVFNPSEYSSGHTRASCQQLFHAAVWALTTKFLKPTPTHRWPAGINLFHGDAIGNWAHQSAQVAPDTLVFEDSRHKFCDIAGAEIAARTLLRRDALVRAVFAGDIAEVASDALLRDNARDDFVVEIKVTPVANAID